MITKNKWENLKKLMSSLDIYEENIDENFIKGSGKGGQKLNKSSTCVQLKYKNLEVKCQKTRSQSDNRFWARRELCHKVMELKNDFVSKKNREYNKIRKQKLKRSKRAKEKIMEIKINQSNKKKLRRKIDF
jgi:protein subunit release factor B